MKFSARCVKVKQMTGQIAKLGLAASAVSIVASVYIYFMHDGGDTTLGLSLIHISEPTRRYAIGEAGVGV